MRVPPRHALNQTTPCQRFCSEPGYLPRQERHVTPTSDAFPAIVQSADKINAKIGTDYAVQLLRALRDAEHVIVSMGSQ